MTTDTLSFLHPFVIFKGFIISCMLSTGLLMHCQILTYSQKYCAARDGKNGYFECKKGIRRNFLGGCFAIPAQQTSCS